MRTPATAPILLTAVVAGCTRDLPTALRDGSPVAGARVSVNEAVLPFHGTLDAQARRGASP